MAVTMADVAERMGLPRSAGEEVVLVGVKRDRLVAATAADGRIVDSPENRAKWRRALDEGGVKAEAELARLAPALVDRVASEQSAVAEIMAAGFGIDVTKRGRR